MSSGTGCDYAETDRGCGATLGISVCVCQEATGAAGSSGSASNDDGMASGKVAGIVIAVLLILFVIAAVIYIKQKGMPALPGVIKDNAVNITLVMLSLALLFAFCGLVSKSMLVGSSTGDSKFTANIGVFTTTLVAPRGGVTYTYVDNEDTCDTDNLFLYKNYLYGPEDGSCKSSLRSRCGAAKAFSVIGFLANFAVVAAVVLQKIGLKAIAALPKLVVPVLALATSFCYMLVYATWAEIHNSDNSPDGEASGCGFETSKSDDWGLGAAFGLWVVASLMTGCVGVLMLLLAGGGGATISGGAKHITFNNTVNEAYSDTAQLDKNDI